METGCRHRAAGKARRVVGSVMGLATMAVSSSRLTSRASALWVSQPREITSTPVAAKALISWRLMPPDASVIIR